MRIRHNKRSKEIIEQCEFLINNPDDCKTNWRSIFNNDNPIHLEIGMGKGDFLLGMALKYPDINFIGIEKYDTIIAKAIEKISELNITNIKLIRIDANKITDYFENEIDVIYLNFSDPWPKVRHANRRLTSPIFLDLYNSIFKGNNIIIQKTDNVDLFEYSLESLKEKEYEIVDFTRDLHQTNLDNVMSEYEKKFSSKGIKINYLKAIKMEEDK